MIGCIVDDRGVSSVSKSINSERERERVEIKEGKYEQTISD